MNKKTNFKKTCIALSVAQAWSIGQVHAATMRVTTGTDEVANGCTFRNAVRAINSRQDGNGCTKQFGSAEFGIDDTIEFSISNITLEGGQDFGQITIEDALPGTNPTHVRVSINPGGNRVIIRRSSLSASDFRIFEIQNSTVSFDNVEITGGKTSDKGGGIKINIGSVSLNNSSVSGNSATGSGGGISSFYGTTTLNNSTVSDNSTAGDGGGIYNDSGTSILNNSTVSGNSATGEGGGIYSTSSTTTLNNSTLSGNSAAGYGGGGIFNHFSTVILNGSTVAANSASESGGGGICTTSDSTTTIDNSTVSGNYSRFAGGIWAVGGTINLSNSTVSSNEAVSFIGGIYNETNGIITLNNSIVAGNILLPSGNFSEVRSFDGVMNTSNSLFGNSTFGFNPVYNPADNNIVVDLSSTNLDSVLLPLTDNGGPTQTHALPEGSPAIDAGDNASCPATDQRGEARDSQCDIGAYEDAQDETDFIVVPLPNGKAVIFGL